MSRDSIMLLRQHGQVQLHWPRLAAEQLFIGRSADDACALAGRLFALCSHAQSLAARLALACASGQAAAADSSALDSVRQEAIRETLRRWLLDWGPACGQAPDPRCLTALGQARTLADCAVLAEHSVFGTRTRAWRQYGLAGWQKWAASGHSPAARALQVLLQQPAEPAPALLVLPASCWLAAAPHWLAGAHPAWHGQAVETGALARYHHLLQPWLHAGHLSAARLLARLLALADALLGVPPHACASPLAGSGLARVDTARGPLLHLATLGGDGRISHYRVLPPTLWHTHPAGCMVQAAANGDSAQITRRLLLIDPCVSFTLAGFDNKEHAHA